MRYLLPILCALSLSGCISVKLDTEPIKIDHTITLRVEREVDSFLDDLYGDTEDEDEAGPDERVFE